MSDKQHLSPSRRRFLKTGALAGAAGLWTAKPALAMTSPQTGGRSGQARNVIFMVADGMCHGTLGLAHHWQLKHTGERLNWMQLYDRARLAQRLAGYGFSQFPGYRFGRSGQRLGKRSAGAERTNQYHSRGQFAETDSALCQGGRYGHRAGQHLPDHACDAGWFRNRRGRP